MVEPASPTAGVDIRRDYAVRTGAVSVGIDPESAQVASQRPWRRWPSWMRHRDRQMQTGFQITSQPATGCQRFVLRDLESGNCGGPQPSIPTALYVVAA